MSDIESVKLLARQLMMVNSQEFPAALFVWERTERILQNVEFICGIDRISKEKGQIDRFCLDAAVCFCEIGTVRHTQKRRASHPEELKGIEILTASAEIADRELSKLLDSSHIQKICMTIIESASHFSSQLEANILCDARNLDDMGLAGILAEFRRCTPTSPGKATNDIVSIWQRKIDYGYWQARLKEDFHFPEVRRIASHRIVTAEKFMSQLSRELASEDLAQAITLTQPISDSAASFAEK
ncbi:MAG: hypothetical protein PHF37_08905 [Phycisphaerae bacterium]|nr:hypothetical protein [Phycisphaerae bacterium]